MTIATSPLLTSSDSLINNEFLGNFIDLTLLCRRKYSILMILIMSIMETWQWSCQSSSLPRPHHWHHQSPRLRRIHDENHDLLSRSYFSGIWLDLWSDLVWTHSKLVWVFGDWEALQCIIRHYLLKDRRPFIKMNSLEVYFHMFTCLKYDVIYGRRLPKVPW